MSVVNGRPGKLVLVFDQSFPHSSEKQQLEKTKEKLAWLAEHGVYGVAYCSHANFLLASSDKEVLGSAKRTLETEARLPRSRLVTYRDA